jgi:hypothetical protein
MSRYYSGAAGRCYFYASTASVTCPNATGPSSSRDEWEAEHESLTSTFAELGLDAYQAMSSAHRAGSFADPDRPGFCRRCGARLASLGYRTWVEARLEDPALDISDFTRSANLALGGGWMVVPGSVRHWPKKKEAIEWAREEASIDKAAAREELHG